MCVRQAVLHTLWYYVSFLLLVVYQYLSVCTTGCVAYTMVLRIISTTGCVSIAECMYDRLCCIQYGITYHFYYWLLYQYLSVCTTGCVAYTMVLRIISTTGCVSISECMYDRLCCIHYGITYHFYYWLCINS